MFPIPHKVLTELAWRDVLGLLPLWAGKGTTVWTGTDVLLRLVLPAWNHPLPRDAPAEQCQTDSNKPQAVWMELSWLCA